MRRCNQYGLVLVAFLAILTAGPRAMGAPDVSTHHVETTYNGRPFDYTMEQTAALDNYDVYRLTYPSPVVTPVETNNTIPADYYLPKGIRPGDPKRPAVVCLHILDGQFELVRMVCSSLASRGIPAIMFKLPYYGERSLPGGRQALLRDPALFLGALPQGIEDVRRTVDLLASRDEVHSDHLGVAGISMGGLLGATAAARDPRLSRAVLILAGGDLATIIDTASETRELKLFLDSLEPSRRRDFDAVIDEMDPLKQAATLRGRAERGRVLMINGTDDQVIPRACAEKLAAALGIADRVAWLDGLGHYTAVAALPEIMAKTVDFFAQDMPKGVEIPSSATQVATPAILVGRLLGEAATMMSVEPARGRCHIVALKVEMEANGGKSVATTVELIRGHGARFRLSCDLGRPVVIKAALGDDGSPWIAADRAVFRGSGEPGAEPPPAVDSAHLLKLRMAAGALTGAAMAPSLLDSLLTIDEQGASSDGRSLLLKSKRNPDWATLVLRSDDRSPKQIRFEIGKVKGNVAVRAWRVDAPASDELFAPPGDLPVTEVSRADVERMFASLFNFVMENVP
ncbi:MAG TPA: hypothetical protein DD670_01565 [Planctomycetaceae bacterium]|nr:hypothetical protein [Planctomycetaceae bacterium]